MVDISFVDHHQADRRDAIVATTFAFFLQTAINEIGCVQGEGG
jgi:hypothetical protein